MRFRPIAILFILLSSAADARAGSQLFEGSWVVKAFGNERSGGTGDSEFYSASRFPLGIQCNEKQPRCPYESTPTNGRGKFDPLGGSLNQALYCTPWLNWGGAGTTMRWPRRYSHYYVGKTRWPILPLYRNWAFFTPNGHPNTTHCDPRSTSLGGFGSLGGGPGVAQVGRPVTGTGVATTTNWGNGRFGFAAAPPYVAFSGIRGTGIVGERPFDDRIVYQYTYATLRNATGFFGPGSGPGSFSIPYAVKGITVAKVKVKQGAAKFGGTMRMLGALTSKVSYCTAGAYVCSVGYNDWRYDAIGATGGYTASGVVTKGYQVQSTAIFEIPALGQFSSAMLVGSRFPWTTGTATVTAVGRGPHKTVHYAKGYDNRTPTHGRGTIQLVTPVLTHWLRPVPKFETVGVGILRIKFAPEPHAWWMLIAGISCLGVLARRRSDLRLQRAAARQTECLERTRTSAPACGSTSRTSRS
jgi:hypothetical protein